MKNDLSIAVVGGGVAGITASFLLQEKHKVTLFEKNDYVGGHTHTVTLDSGPDQGLRIDTGFIVMNDKTYPSFSQLLSRLKVKIEKTDMSFSYYCKETGLQYGTSSLDSIMAQRKNILNPAYWKFLLEIMRFFRTARRALVQGSLGRVTLEEFIREQKFSHRFRDEFLLPMSAAIWSASDREMGQFPMESFARFYENHGLLSVSDHPQWYFVKGGSRSYVEAFLNQFPGDVYAGAPVQSIRRRDKGITLTLSDGTRKDFDAVVIAAHADEALGLLEDPSPDEERLLSPWRYSNNRVILHTDTSLLPTNIRARASWNTIREPGHRSTLPVTVTYDMTRLQNLDTNITYCVTLNPVRPIPQKHIIASMLFTHPVFDFSAMDTQSGLPGLNGQRNTWFCGSYFAYGFHEDAVHSSVQLGRDFGVDL